MGTCAASDICVFGESAELVKVRFNGMLEIGEVTRLIHGIEFLVIVGHRSLI